VLLGGRLAVDRHGVVRLIDRAGAPILLDGAPLKSARWIRSGRRATVTGRARRGPAAGCLPRDAARPAWVIDVDAIERGEVRIEVMQRVPITHWRADGVHRMIFGLVLLGGGVAFGWYLAVLYVL